MSTRLNRYMTDTRRMLSDTSRSLVLFALRLLTGLAIGTTFALMGEAAVGYSTFVFTFVIVVFTWIVLRFSRGWRFTTVIVFDLFCILIALLLRMYILVAPGS